MITNSRIPSELWFKILSYEVTNKEVSLVSSQFEKIFNNPELKLARVQALLASRGINVVDNNLDSCKKIILEQFSHLEPDSFVISRYENIPDLTLSRILLEEDANNLCLIADRIPLIKPQDAAFKESSKLQKRKMIIDLLNKKKEEIEKIEEIDLKSLTLTAIPPELTFFIGLKKINLTGNKIKTIPEYFSNSFNQLEICHIDHNPIQSLPTHFGKEWKNLKELSLDGLLKINNVDADFGCHFTELESIRFSYSALEAIPAGFGKAWSKIQKVYLHRNKLRQLPDGFGDSWKNIEVLQVLDNSFSKKEEIEKGLMEKFPELILLS